MIAVGNNELDHNGTVGTEIYCDKCKTNHPIVYGDKVLEDGTKRPSAMLAFYKCSGSVYLAGIDGQLLK